MQIRLTTTALAAVLMALSACGSDDGGAATQATRSIYGFANGCFSVQLAGSGFLTRDGAGFDSDETNEANATPFFLKPSRLGSYVIYDDARGYLVSGGTELLRSTALQSDILLVDDTYQSEAEWTLEESGNGAFHLRHRKSGGYVAADGSLADAGAAAAVSFHGREDCADFPEEDTDSEGGVVPLTFDDGSVFGFADTHSHIFSNFAFGGGGIFHGAPYHALGVEHALPSCEMFHGPDGRADFFGAGFDTGSNIDLESFIPGIVTGLLPEFNHFTDGYPEFTEWPSGPFSSTHQTQYYKWIERAYLSGLRLVVQHATGNQIICDFLGNGGYQPIRYSCNDMVTVDRQIVEAYRMQDYIDAQEGGPGEGWFRIVTTPAQAREVISDGKMAVVLGIEISNLFDCFSVPRIGFAPCTEEDVVERLGDYYDRGVRVLFPVHKYDNAFSAGDGNKAFIELGNVIQTGHFASFTTDCDLDVPTVFDRGPLAFPGLNEPRDDYFAAPPNDFSEFFLDPIAALAPNLDRLLEPPLPGNDDYCQNHGLTELGEFLIERVMRSGMILEVDHLPRKSYRRAYEILVGNDYPAVGTHGLDNNGLIYALGGTSKAGFNRCRAEDRIATVDDGYQNRVQTIRDNGGFPALGFGFDLNGFAGAQRPRFGERGCSSPQSDPVTYPFESYAGDVTFTEPSIGNRTLDFNTEGMVHIGLVAELIEDVRRDGVSDEELEPLFKSAEAYIRVWEKAERRGQELSGRAQ